jgi:phage-related protein
LTILQTVLSLVTGTVKDNVVPLVDEIAELLGTILCGVLKLVGDLVTEVLVDVLQLINGLIPFILNLNVRLLLTALGIQS